jgi:hypothetical protein
MDRSEAERIIHALELFAATGHGDVNSLKRAVEGRYRQSRPGLLSPRC